MLMKTNSQAVILVSLPFRLTWLNNFRSLFSQFVILVQLFFFYLFVLVSCSNEGRLLDLMRINCHVARRQEDECN